MNTRYVVRGLGVLAVLAVLVWAQHQSGQQRLRERRIAAEGVRVRALVAQKGYTGQRGRGRLVTVWFRPGGDIGGQLDGPALPGMGSRSQTPMRPSDMVVEQGQVVYRPVVEGTQVVSRSFYESVSSGDTVTVSYLPADPEQFVIVEAVAGR